MVKKELAAKSLSERSDQFEFAADAILLDKKHPCISYDTSAVDASMQHSLRGRRSMSPLWLRFEAILDIPATAANRNWSPASWQAKNSRWHNEQLALRVKIYMSIQKEVETSSGSS